MLPVLLTTNFFGEQNSPLVFLIELAGALELTGSGSAISTCRRLRRAPSRDRSPTPGTFARGACYRKPRPGLLVRDECSLRDDAGGPEVELHNSFSSVPTTGLSMFSILSW